jgi:hypothetical protein
VRLIVARIHALRGLAPPAHLAQSEGLLLPRSAGHGTLIRLYAVLSPRRPNGPAAPHW